MGLGTGRPPVVRRTTATLATVALCLTAAGCGGGGGGASKAGYYGSIDRFCADVAKAAKQVSRDTSAVSQDKAATRGQVVKVVTDSLQHFAASTETALNTLQKAAVPGTFAGYHQATTKGFRTFIATLRSTADAATSGGADALSRLGPRLRAIKLPSTPPDITANARACARFSPAPG